MTETETPPGQTPETADAPEQPSDAVFEFHANTFKLKVMGILGLLMAAWFLWLAIKSALPGAAPSLQASAQGPSPLVAGLGGLFFAVIAVVMWREANLTKPLLRVTAWGIEDRLFGDFPWEQVRNYRMITSFFSSGFGYTLKKGVYPQRLTPLYLFQASMNFLSRMPARCFRKQMVVGGCDPMLMAFRVHAPELEGKK